MLAQAGMTPDSYEAERRQALQIQQLTEGIQLSDFLTAPELNRIYALENEQREIRYAVLPVEHYASAKIDDAQVKAWYDAHPGDYLSPESVKLQYAQLSLDSIAQQLRHQAMRTCRLITRRTRIATPKRRSVTRTTS